MEKIKKNRMNFVFSDKTAGQLAELQRVLSAKTGAQLSKTQTLEMAIDLLLDHFARDKQQGRLI